MGQTSDLRIAESGILYICKAEQGDPKTHKGRDWKQQPKYKKLATEQLPQHGSKEPLETRAVLSRPPKLIVEILAFHLKKERHRVPNSTRLAEGSHSLKDLPA
jgi:hypothetical protein